ncbi:MAG TPA: polysaccharide deacetylase family protein [Acidimicrobiales bacterium]
MRTDAGRGTVPAGRSRLKSGLARLPHGGEEASGLTVLIYHRVGGGTPDELDTPAAAFATHLDVLAGHEVVSMDAALDRLDAGDERPTVVLTFDDGFADVHTHAWPLLAERRLPFTVYPVAGSVGGTIKWEGGTAKAAGAALSWEQLEELAASGLCTVGNHTWSHPRPQGLTEDELDRCSDEIEARLGVRPRHFAYTWGIEVPGMRPALATRFRSAVTGTVGRNGPDADRLALRRVPVRASDPIEFFRAKLSGGLVAERAYDLTVRAAKRMGLRG